VPLDGVAPGEHGCSVRRGWIAKPCDSVCAIPACALGGVETCLESCTIGHGVGCDSLVDAYVNCILVHLDEATCSFSGCDTERQALHRCNGSS